MQKEVFHSHKLQDRAASSRFWDIPFSWSEGLGSLVIPKNKMVVHEGPKIFYVQWIWRRIFVSLEKIFVFKCLQTIFHLVFTWNIYGKNYKNFFGRPYCSNGTKIHLDAALPSQRNWHNQLSHPSLSHLEQGCQESLIQGEIHIQ